MFAHLNMTLSVCCSLHGIAPLADVQPNYDGRFAGNEKALLRWRRRSSWNKQRCLFAGDVHRKQQPSSLRLAVQRSYWRRLHKHDLAPKLHLGPLSSSKGLERFQTRPNEPESASWTLSYGHELQRHPKCTRDKYGPSKPTTHLFSRRRFRRTIRQSFTLSEIMSSGR